MLKTRSKIDIALKLIYAEPRFHFDEPTKQRARQLYNKGESSNWGQGEVIDDDSSENDELADTNDPADSKRRKSSASTVVKRDSKAGIVPTRSPLPSASHPIFGEDGIMHGLMLKITPQRKSYVLDPRYPKRDAKVFGHNALEVGSWWPMQLAALFHEAHGAKISGIAGNVEMRAYSVVTSGGAYEELDQDKGDILYYSGSHYHDNDDPKKPFPSSNATLALKASRRLNRPVRVLRAAGVSGSKTAANIRPTVGIRYDGLYHVVDLREKTNTKGGLYEHFKLVREEGQLSLSGIKRPTGSETRDYYKRDEGY